MTGWLVETLVASTLLMALVLLVRGAVRRVAGPQLAYALWALPLLRLLLPPMPSNWREEAVMPISRASEALVLIVPAAAPVPAPLPWVAMIGAVWGAGSLAFFVHHLLRHRRFCRRVLTDARAVDEVAGVRVIESAAVRGPLAFGVTRRFVALPADFAERYDADERALAVAHELGHHARADLLANWIALGVLALHWFNPVAWRAFRAFRCDQELATDARVLAGRSRADAHVYACAILKAAHGGHISAACHLHTIADLKGRLRMLTRSTPSRCRFAAGSASVVGLVAVGLAGTASGTPAAAVVSERIGKAMASELRVQETPVVPAAPAIPPPPSRPATPATPATPAAPATPTTPRAPAAPPVPAPPLSGRGGETTTVTSSDGETNRLFTTKQGVRLVMVALPEITRRACVDGPDGGPKQFILDRREGDRRIFIMCINRIEKAAAGGAAVAANSRHVQANALRTARAGLRTARAGIAASRGMAEAQRAQALAGITRAEAALDAQKD